MDIPFHILEQSTNGFSDEEKLLGCGGYGKVYKGLDQNGTDIAVKVLHPMLGNDHTPIQNEFTILMKLKHSNIVRLVGYCYEDVRKHVMHQGQLIFSTHMHRILCFEYVHGGSLCNYLSEESCGCEWSTRYNIIKGICDGLNFMHGLDKPIFHLDLKPSNILLDKNMKAKIADFGLSKLFHGTHTHTTSIVIGTWKYMPPEFITKHHISEKNDVFSLGIIIIEIMTGPAGYEKFGEMDVTQFTELVNMNWRNRIHATSSIYPIEEVAQVETCIKIAVECVDSERKNRPTVKEIVHRLSETEITNPKDRRNGAPSLIGQVCSEASITKFGLWGGKGGASHDLEVLPQRLISVVVRCGKVIDSLAFTYCDFNGQQRTGGPWGDRAAHEGDGSIHTILLGPSEFLLEVNGTIGPSPYFGDAVMVSSIMFVTNTDSYGPFGEGGGTKFQSPVRENGSIVGFYANAGGHIDAVGFYYKLEREIVKQEVPTYLGSSIDRVSSS
uniref:Uncharacterized protein n=1 Tax=Avena sativa TaxID=4498 RepID=A0ACD5ZTD7_AVESA